MEKPVIQKLLLRIGGVAGFGLLVAVMSFLVHQPGTPVPGAPPPNAPQAAAASDPPPPDEPAMVNEPQRDHAAHLLGEARRMVAAGKFSEAEKAINRAEKMAPGFAATRELRREIAELETPHGRLAAKLQQARLALEHDDRPAARQALGEAEALDAVAPGVAELRQALQAADQAEAGQQARIAALIVQMRAAITRGDLAAAHGALNEAERIDLLAPPLARARRELARAEEGKG